MTASNRVKRRLLGFIASRGGRVTSGRNDSLLRWAFEIFARESYAHERIDDLEEVFEALEGDGDLVLERDERGKLIAAHLADDADYRHADFESGMFESPDELWALLVTLLSINARQRKQIDESDIEVAIELAADAERRAHALSDQLELARETIADLKVQAVPARQQADLESELDAVRQQLAIAQSRIRSMIESRDLAAERWRSEKADLRDKISKKGSEVVSLSKRLDAADRTNAFNMSMLSTLRLTLRDHGIVVKVIDVADL